MPWVRLDDKFSEHEKIAEVGLLGMAVVVAAKCYCNRNLTDGRIPKREALKLAGGTLEYGVDPRDLIADLLRVCLWEDRDGAYWVHDFLKYNPSKEKVLRERAQAAERKERWKRRNAVENAVPPTVPNAVENAPGNGGGTAEERTDPKPVPVTPHEEDISSSLRSYSVGGATSAGPDNDEQNNGSLAQSADATASRAAESGFDSRGAHLGAVAQQVERRGEVPCVTGSIPVGTTNRVPPVPAGVSGGPSRGSTELVDDSPLEPAAAGGSGETAATHSEPPGTEHREQPPGPSPNKASTAAPGAAPALPASKAKPLNGKRRKQSEPHPDESLAVHALNAATGRTGRSMFTVAPEASALLRANEPVEDLILVAEWAAATWPGTKRAGYVRPKTLYGRDNFAQYRPEAAQWDERGRSTGGNGAASSMRRDLDTIAQVKAELEAEERQCRPHRVE